MRLGFTISVAALLVMVGVSFAGDYHTNTTLICADCHVMHYSQTHGYSADGSGAYLAPGAGGPNEFLLRYELPKLCLACHDGQLGIPDVLEANTGVNVRAAGALNKTTSTGTYVPTDGHTLGSTAVAPGGTYQAANGLDCNSCHSVHGGDGRYRNLRSTYGTITYAISTNDLAKDVFERAARGYDAEDVDYNEPGTGTTSKMGAWCQGCHTSFHGSSSAAGMRDQSAPAGQGWFRHPTADANIGAIGGGHSSLDTFKAMLYRPKVMSATGQWGTQGTAWADAPSTLTPSCFTCHKAHGNANPFGLMYMTGSAAPGENGDGTEVRELCSTCHNKTEG
jgi:hypothetical protein